MTFEPQVSSSQSAGGLSRTERGSPSLEQSWRDLASGGAFEKAAGAWLEILSSDIAGVRKAVLAGRTGEGEFSALARWPREAAAISELQGIAKDTIKQRKGLILSAKDRVAPVGAKTTPDVSANPSENAFVSYPIEDGGKLTAVVVLEVTARAEAALQDILRRIHWGAGVLTSMYLRARVSEHEITLSNFGRAMDLVCSADQGERLEASALAFANEIQNWLGARRVSLGLLIRGRMTLCAISNTATFKKGTAEARMLTGVMEEGTRQGAAVIVENDHASGEGLTLFHRTLLQESGTGTVLSVPVTAEERIIGSLVVEMPRDQALPRDALDILEAAANYAGPGFDLRRQANRLISGRLRSWLGTYMSRLLGTRYVKVKVITALLAAAVILPTVMTGTFRIAADAVIEGTVQRAVITPFDGFIREVRSRAGDEVKQGEVMARLEDRDLVLRQRELESEKGQVLQRMRASLAKRERGEVILARGELESIQAQLALVESQLELTRIRSPMDGVVISGDLEERVGSPTETGEVLFQVAPADTFRLALLVDERDIALIETGQSGQMMVKGLPGETIGFAVQRIAALSQAGEGQNRFRVVADVPRTATFLRPGMEGVAKINIGEQSLLWSWSRRLLNWVRLTVWSWLP